jgi:hypothetical protein
LKKVDKIDKSWQIAHPGETSWIKKKYPEGYTKEKYPNDPVLVKFVPDANLDRDVSRVAEWISAAIEDKAQWLQETKDTDEDIEKRRPDRLREIGDLKRALHYANDALIQRQGGKIYEDIPGSVEPYMELENGFHIVKLLTPEAVVREGNQVGHCWKDNPLYGDRLSQEDYNLYSLRDGRNWPHVHFEVGGII